MLLPTLEYETNLWNQGYRYVVGLDEVGRGAWAGPIVVGAVIFSPDIFLPRGIRDSKELRANQRSILAEQIKDKALAYSFGLVNVEKINLIGIGKATHEAMRKALKNLKIKPDFHLVDAFYVKRLKRALQKPLKKGDKICSSIASASIIAKVFRDNLMIDLAKQFPKYFFDQNKGYGTKIHQEAIRENGFCEIHRTSFNLNWLKAHE